MKKLISDRTRVSKTVTFDAAHRLPFHKGLCKNLHGHTYKLEVFFELTPYGQSQKEANKEEFVVDFGEMKEIINKAVVSRLDHALICCYEDTELFEAAQALGTKVCILPHETTAENIVLDIHYWLTERLTLDNLPEVIVPKIKLWETPNSCVTYDFKEEDTEDWGGEDNA